MTNLRVQFRSTRTQGFETATPAEGHATPSPGANAPRPAPVLTRIHLWRTVNGRGERPALGVRDSWLDALSVTGVSGAEEESSVSTIGMFPSDEHDPQGMRIETNELRRARDSSSRAVCGEYSPGSLWGAPLRPREVLTTRRDSAPAIGPGASGDPAGAIFAPAAALRDRARPGRSRSSTSSFPAGLQRRTQRLNRSNPIGSPVYAFTYKTAAYRRRPPPNDCRRADAGMAADAVRVSGP
jgi:hypothetical protein